MLKSSDYNFNLHSWKIPAKTNGMSVMRSESLTYVDSGLSCDTFNIIHITDAGLLTEREFLHAVNHFRNKNFLFCIWISGENLSSHVKAIIKKASLKQQNKEPGMGLDLATYNPVQDVLHENIIVANTSQGVRDFAEVVALNWTPPDQNVRKYFAMTTDSYLDPANGISLAIYYHERKPVSVIEIFPSNEETIGFYSLATLLQYRGKGIGSTLMRFALNKAKEDGYKFAILQASEDGIGIYEKYGFRVMTQYYEFG
jgi:GNAT superfamily N-acetyltransferase